MRIKFPLMQPIAIIILLANIFTGALIAAETEQGVSPETVFAEYRDGKITKADFDEEFDKIPVMYRSQFATLQGKENLLNSLIINNIFYQKALEMGIDQDPETIAALDNALNRYYSREFMRRDVTGKVELAESAIREYYEQYPDRFSTNANSVIQYLEIEDEETANLVRAELDQGTDHIDLMNRYSVNEYTKRNQGIIRNIRGNGYIQGVGREEALDEAIKEAPLNSWQGPVVTDIGYHFFKVTERTPSRLKPLSEVREEIVNRLRPIQEAELRESVLDELIDEYGVTVDEELLVEVNLATLTPESENIDQVVVNSNQEDLQITMRDIHNQYRRINPQERAQLANPQQLLRWVNSIVELSLFGYEARRKEYEQYLMEDPEVRQVKRNTILSRLFQQLVVDYAAAADEDVEEYYLDNIANYTTPEQRNVQLFLYDARGDARRAYRTVRNALRNNEPELIDEVIANSLYTRNNGIINNVLNDPEHLIFNEDKTMNKTVWDTNVGNLSSVKRNDERQFFFIRVIDETPHEVVPLAQVKESIRNSLSTSMREQRWMELQEELKEEFDVTAYPERLAASLTARELFDLAEDAVRRNRFNEALDHYNRIINTFKNNHDDYNAMFMKGFLLAEQLEQEEEAIVVFEALMENYPPDDLHDSAEYMIKHLRDGYDIFGDQ